MATIAEAVSAEWRVRSMIDCKTCKYEDMCLIKDKISKKIEICTIFETAGKQTNAERIRSFSDEELAEFIEQVSTDSMETISFGTKEYEEIWEHKETALQWLQSEVEE